LAGRFVPSDRTYDIGTPCVFFKDGGCAVHAAKPTICKQTSCWSPETLKGDMDIYPEFTWEQLIELGWNGETECEEY